MDREDITKRDGKREKEPKITKRREDEYTRGK